MTEQTIHPHYQFSTKRGDDIFVLTWNAGTDADEAEFMRRAASLKVKVFAADATEPNVGSAPPDSEKTIVVESIALASGGEHPRWVIKGKPFTKFGVTCWPETLETAGLLKKLDPLKENKPQARWTAHYVEKKNEKGELVPDKIVRLERL